MHRKRRGGIISLVVAILVIGVLAVGGFAVLGGFDNNDGADGRRDVALARQQDFDVTILASGELAALNQIEVRNQLENQATINEIIDEGTFVEKGDVLFRLADKEIKNKIKDAEDAKQSAEAELTSALSNLDLLEKAKRADLQAADLKIELAEIALEAWDKGEVVSKRKQLDLALETAEINYERLVDRYEESKKLVADKHISQDEFKRDEIAMIEARAALDQAKIDIEVYEKYLHLQQKKQKESDVQQARDERDRVEQRADTEIESARAQVESRRHNLQSRIERLADLEHQLEQCVVTAPSSGLVVYATSLDRGWRDDDNPPQVGTSLHPNELVMVLPDTSRIVANIKVNEALSGVVKAGQRATIISDAVPDTTLNGTVLGVGVLAEGGGWRDPNRRDYTVRVLIDGNGNELGLKPSMRCRANIYVERVQDALAIPIQAVFRESGVSYVYVPQGSGYAQREVELGRSSEMLVEATGGLEPGDEVLLREPRPEEIVSRLKIEKQAPGPGSMPDELEDELDDQPADDDNAIADENSHEGDPAATS